VLDLGAVLIVIVVWIALRFVIAIWVSRRAETGAFSPLQVAVVYSLLIAIAPLLLLPWRHSEGDVIFLVGAAVVIFLGKIGLISYAIERRDPR
jgi:hypothetical protein